MPADARRTVGRVIGPQELAQRLGVPEPTPDQAAVIQAPLAPMAVVAGAGSGKSETMAARVVWLVANGLVRPERVLGLTFTRKAAAELSDRVRRRLGQLREHDDLVDPAVLDGEPTVSTYHAYAARLFGDHALRAALEPTMRLITPAVAWQVAARVVDAYDGPMDHVEWDIIDARRKAQGLPPVAATGKAALDPLQTEGFDVRQPQHIALAGALGLGLYEYKSNKGRRHSIDHKVVTT